jgi:hypothetical protein
MKILIHMVGVIMLISACGDTSPISKYEGDCALLVTNLDHLTSDVVAQVESFQPRSRLVDRVVIENGRIRRFVGPDPSEVIDWRRAATRTLEANTPSVYASTWPDVSNEDLGQVLKELSRNEYVESNSAALSTMCPLFSLKVQESIQYLTNAVDDKAQSLEYPAPRQQ